MAGEAKMLTGWARRSFFRAQHVAAQLQPKCTPRSITRFRGTITAVTRLHGHFLYAGAARGFASSQNESNRKQPLNVFWTLPSPEDIATATVTELHQCLSWVYRKLAKPLEQHGAVAIYASRTIQFTAMVRSFGCRLESLDPETALGVLESLVRLLWRCPQRSHQKIQRVAEMSFERFLQGSFQVKTADLPRFYLMLVRARVRKASFIAYVETHLGAIARQLDVTGTLTFVKVLDALSMTEEEYVLPLRENLERCSTNLSATEAVKVLSTLSETFFEDEKMLHYAVEQVTTKVATLPSHIMILAYRLLTVLDQDTSLFLKMMAPLIIHRLDQKKLSLNAVFDLMQMLCVDHMAQRSLALELLKDFAAEKHAYTRVRGQQPHCISSAKALYVAFACLRFAPTGRQLLQLGHICLLERETDRQTQTERQRMCIPRFCSSTHRRIEEVLVRNACRKQFYCFWVNVATVLSSLAAALFFLFV